MPRAKLILELDDPKDCFEILKGNEGFGRGKVSLKVGKKELLVEVEADDAKSMISAVGSIIKQVRIIKEASAAIGSE